MLQGMDTGPAIEAPVPRMNVKGIESTRNSEGAQVKDIRSAKWSRRAQLPTPRTRRNPEVG